MELRYENVQQIVAKYYIRAYSNTEQGVFLS